MKKIDTRGLSCPQPVIMVSNEIKKGNKNFEVLIDSECSSENVLRTVEKHNLKAQVEEKDGITIYKVSEK